MARLQRLLVHGLADWQRLSQEAAREIKRVKKGCVLLIPASDQTAGHGTTAQARFWKQHLADLLHSVPRRTT